MVYSPLEVARHRRLTGIMLFLALLLIAFINPNTRSHEVLLLSCLGALAAGYVGLILFAHSRRMLRMMRMARREHSLFKAAAEGSQQPFFICEPVCDDIRHIVDFRITYANKGTEKLFGLDRQHLRNKSMAELLPREMFDPLVKTWAQVSGTGAPEDVIMDVVVNGQEESYETHVIAMGGGVAISITRAHDERAAATRIQELDDFAQSIIESAPISIIATDAMGTIIAMNSAAEQLTQYRKYELVGQHSLLLLHDASEISARAVQLNKALEEPVVAGFASLVARSSDGFTDEREWTYIRKDGSRVWVSLSMTKLCTGGSKVTGYLGMAFDVTERKRLSDSVVHMAHHDQLTGLPNRALLHDRLEQGIVRAMRNRQRVAVFLIDIDHFKRINDSLGHTGGDALLTFVSRQLASAVRGTDTVARIGGDEFVVVMPEFRSAEDAERCAELMRQKIDTPFMVGTREVRVSASIGICLYPDCGESSAELLRNADAAMYIAKAAGGGHHLYSRDMEEEAADKLEMEEDLRHALEHEEFSLHYQPQIHCQTGEVTGMETLLRWNSPKRGMVPPTMFIPIAEEAALMGRIGEWSLQQACFDCVAAGLQLGRPLTVAFNLSPRQFSQRNLIPLVREALESSGLPAHQLEIEITEQMLMANTPSVMQALADIRELGVKVAIDDFGTGFSSFAYILQYAVDRLKIDQSFISKCTFDAGAAAVARTILAMAHGLNIEVVAEGVETLEQFNFLMRRKCDTAQGFLFSEAVPIGALTQKILEIDAWTEEKQVFASRSESFRDLRPESGLDTGPQADACDTTYQVIDRRPSASSHAA